MKGALMCPALSPCPWHVEGRSPRTVKDKSRHACFWKLIIQMSSPYAARPGAKLKDRPG